MNADNAALMAETEALQLLDAGPLSQEVLIRALRAAAASGHVAALLILLAARVSKECKHNKRRRALAALETACDSGHADCVAAVLERGCLPAGQCDVAVDVAVQNALRGDHVACLRVLLDRLWPANLEKPRHAANYFVSAAAQGAVVCMDELRRRGVDPRTVRRSETPLLAVCRASNHLAVAECLCRAGVDVDAADAAGVTPLMLACSARRPDFVELLLCFGADPGRAPGGGRGAPLCRVLMSAPIGDAWSANSLRCVLLLLDHGASGHAYAPDGDTVLQSVVRDAPAGACDSILPRLLAAGALVNHYYGYDPPLVAAASRGWVFAVRVLCAHRADVQLSGSADYSSALVVTANGFDSDADEMSGVGDSAACVDELIECGATMSRSDLERSCNKRIGYESARAAAVCGLILARLPLHEPLPRMLEPEASEELFPQALEFAQRRLEGLHGGTDNAAGVQRGLTAALLHRVRDACGGAVAPAHAPFARFRFVAAGGLQRAWAWEREVHRFPVERVALRRAALQVTVAAELAAAVRCVPLLQDAVSSAAFDGGSGGSSSREAEKQCYVALRAAGMWGGMKGAVRDAERAVVVEAEAALEAAVVEAKGAVERLLERIVPAELS